MCCEVLIISSRGCVTAGREGTYLPQFRGCIMVDREGVL